VRLIPCFALLFAACISRAQYPGAIPPPNDLKPGFDSITIREAKDYLTFLSTKCEGRGTGQPGFQKAADYVAAHFKRFGLKPMGDNGTYFQNTTFYRARVIPKTLAFKAGDFTVGGAREINLRTFQDVEAEGPIVLIRAKGANSTLDPKDNLRDKIVLLDADHVGRRLRFQIQGSGALAVLNVRDSVGAQSWNVSQQAISPGGPNRISGDILKSAVKALIAHSGDGSAGVLEVSLQNDQLLITDLPGRGHLAAKVDAGPVTVSNVVGLLEGSDPVLKDETIGIGGHLDHLGKQGNVVYPGADDDGSGSTAVLCIANAMSKNPVKPKRSILFMTFFGEEMGLLGSGFLSEHPPVPLEKMDAELQMDMVARDSYGPQNGDTTRIDKVEENVNTMRLVGSKRISTELDQAIQDTNRYIGFKFLYDSEDVYTRSDHYNFARKGVPIAFLFDGFTPDYHQPTDTIEKIDWIKLTSTARLYYLTAFEVGNRQERLKKDVTQ
jgi:hypothetical protein